MHDVVVVNGQGPCEPFWNHKLTICRENKATSFVLCVWIQSELHGFSREIFVEFDEFAMSLAPSDYDLTLILAEECL